MFRKRSLSPKVKLLAMCFAIIAAGLLHAQHHSPVTRLWQKKTHTWKYLLTCLFIFKGSTYILSTCKHKCSESRDTMKLCCQTGHCFEKKINKNLALILFIVGAVFRNTWLNLRTKSLMYTTSEGWWVLTSCAIAESHMTTSDFNLFLAFLHAYYCFFQLRSTFS